MKFNVVSLFPDLVLNALGFGVVGQAIDKGLLEVSAVNPRDFAEDKHKSVDDRPYGGGDGMVMMAPVLEKTLQQLKAKAALGKVIYLSPHGKVWSDQLSREWASGSGPVTLICGRYGGIDQRFIESYVDEEISLGDFVLSGGEFAALAVIDSTARHIAGVLGHPDSANCESFADGLLEHPQFTRPADFLDLPIPEVLKNGHHEKIELWRKHMGFVKTFQKRPDLILESQKSFVKDSLNWAKDLDELELKSCGLTLSILNEMLERL